MSFFCIFGKHLLSLVMLACRIPRGSIFVVATRDYLLLALTNQPSASLWESRSSPLFFRGILSKEFLFFLWFHMRLLGDDSFGNINVPSSQAVLWLRTAIAVFF